MSISRYHMHRLGLVDFWCYENEEFYFKDGHMLLRGSNGSGKSVTMQSFIPLLLDGNKSSERLDSFGTRSRKMDTYLLDENSTREERIGYLYLEFKRKDSDIYKTIGMGLRARKNKPLDSWYFVIEDNRRINRDFSLIENQLTLNEKQLRFILQDQVIKNQGEYMRKVNDSLFGFSNLDDYRDAIDLLLQLRSPKLSNSLSPTKINEILAKSLQPLSDDDLRPMSEAIINMDNLQDELENLKQSLDAANKIAQAYRSYNVAMLLDKWDLYSQEHNHLLALDKIGKEQEKKFDQLLLDEKHYIEEKQDITVQEEITKNERLTLMDTDMERMYEESQTLLKSIDDMSLSLTQKQQVFESKHARKIDVTKEISNYQEQVYTLEKECKSIFENLETLYDTFPFVEHIALKNAFENHQSFDFTYTKQQLKKEQMIIEKIIDLHKDYTFYQNQVDLCYQKENEITAKVNNQVDKVKEKKEVYKNSIEQYQEYFFKYSQNNQVLKLSNQETNEMTESLYAYENTKNYLPIRKIVENQYTSLFQSITKNKGALENQLRQVKKEIDVLQGKYDSLLLQEEIAPLRDDLTIKNRQILKQHEIDYIPLYKIIDFHENVNDLMREKWEELLLQMHLLDAIIVNIKDKDKVLSLSKDTHDYYLWTTTSISDLQTIYLNENNENMDLQKIFQQLQIETNSALEIEDSYFKMGMLEGTLASHQPVSFLGYLRRKQLRDMQLEKLQMELTAALTNENAIVSNIQQENQQLDTLEKELHAFRSDTDLHKTLNEVEVANQQLLFLQKQVDTIIDEKQKHMEKAKDIFSKIKQQASEVYVSTELVAIIARKQEMDEYAMYCDALRVALLEKEHASTLLVSVEDTLQRLLDDMDDLQGEIEVIKRQQIIATGKKETLDASLAELGFSNRQDRLKKLDELLKELSARYEIVLGNIASTKTNQEVLQKEKEQTNIEYQQQVLLETKYKESLLQEINYELVIKNDEQVFSNIKKLKQETIINKKINEYFASFQTVFFERVSYLTQYHIINDTDLMCHQDIRGEDHKILKATHQGKKIPFLELLVILQERIDMQKLLIMDEDRHVFEEILVNTIGKKIRQRIQTSRRWVDKMGLYMEQMNTSSGLQLGLQWRSKKATDEGQIDTVELVKLLEKDYHVLKEKDRQKISNHFRSKIELARRLSLEENTMASFHQLMKEVMDYRDWFDFTLYAKKTNENKKELTNRIFYAYSGGEKAIAMYVPLFSAVAAKFESARQDAPLLIALDEAFAGVDENNIDNLFALITKFEFDYIINSQVLWGDYPSCKSLAIYELFRPNNAPFVTIVPYQWNGLVRTSVLS